MVEYYKKYIDEISTKTGFIKSTLEKVERLLNILEWINNHEKLSKYDLFDKEEKQLLKKCFMLEYIAVNNYKFEDMNIERIEKLEKQDIKTKLLPTLKDRNPKKSNIDVMKHAVRKYLKDILIIDDNTQLFYDKFQKGIYEPELLFDDKKIIERVKEHPMIMWKLLKTT